MEDTVIFRSKKKAVLFIFMAIVFVALGISFVTMEASEIEAFSKFNYPILVRAIGAVVIAFFGAAAVLLLRSLFDGTPALVISHRGIQDSTSIGTELEIPWSEIAGFKESKISSQKFISVMLKHPDRISVGGNYFQRKIRQMNAALCGTPVNISAAGLTMRHAPLLALLLDCFEKYRGDP